MQDDDVCRFYLVGRGSNVDDASVDQIAEPGVVQEPACFVFVRRGQFEIRSPGRAALEQLELDLSDSATDLEDGRACDVVLSDQLDHALRGGVQPASAILVCDASGKPVIEQPVVTTGVTTAGHDAIMAP
jgi:hypothetical protein